MKPRNRKRLKRWTRRTLLFAGVPAVLGIGGLGLGVALVELPEDLFTESETTPVVLDVRGRPVAYLAEEEARLREPVALEDMGTWLPQITVALEDHRFEHHRGIDPHALAGAATRNLKAGRIVSGASTITQQLIKLATRRFEREWSRKVYENFAALRLETQWSKDEILTAYLNRVSYGNRLVGPAAAARAYFGKAPADLTLAEAVYLAGLPQAPTRFNPWDAPENALAKYHRSIDRLRELGEITTAQANRLAATPPVILNRLPERFAPHFVSIIEASEPAGVVRSTLDLELQQVCEALLTEHLDAISGRGASQGAIVVLDNLTGGVRALAGSRDFYGWEGEINGALTPRACGSTLKPFLYLRAIDEHVLTAATLLPDTPDAIRRRYPDYDPVNYDGRFRGPVRVREALANSLNVPAVETLARVGPHSTYFYLEEWGLRFPGSFHDYGAGMILGNAEVRLVDLAAAYAGLAQGGLSVTWKTRVGPTPVSRRVASPQATAIICDILADNDARLATFGPDSPLATEVRIPVKTGTSSGFRDAWTAGFTERHTVAVWVGNFDGRPMDELGSSIAAAPLWRAVIDRLLERDAPYPAPAPGDGLERAAVCALTGLLPLPETATVDEWFLEATQPKDSASALLRPNIDGGTTLFLGDEYAAWCASRWNHLDARIRTDVPLRIQSPAPGAVIVRDGDLPASQQLLPLVALGGSKAGLTWRVNGEAISDQGGNYFWPLEAGEHTAEAITDNGRVAVQFRVE